MYPDKNHVGTSMQVSPKFKSYRTQLKTFFSGNNKVNVTLNCSEMLHHLTRNI